MTKTTKTKQNTVEITVNTFGTAIKYVLKKSIVDVYDVVDAAENNKFDYELAQKHNFTSYLHNLEGPAVEVLNESKQVEYWIDGEKLDDEKAKKFQHEIKFNDEFDQYIEN